MLGQECGHDETRVAGHISQLRVFALDVREPPTVFGGSGAGRSEAMRAETNLKMLGFFRGGVIGQDSETRRREGGVVNITVHDFTYRVFTEGELFALLSALATLDALARRKAA
jgi:hypothetical protein